MALISNIVIKNAPVNANTLPPIYSKMKCGKTDTIEKYKSPPKGAPIATALNITRIKEIIEKKIPPIKTTKSTSKLSVNNPTASPAISE